MEGIEVSDGGGAARGPRLFVCARTFARQVYARGRVVLKGDGSGER